MNTVVSMILRITVFKKSELYYQYACHIMYIDITHASESCSCRHHEVRIRSSLSLLTVMDPITMIRNDCGWNDSVDDNDVARASSHTIDSVRNVATITGAVDNTPRRVTVGKSTSVYNGEFLTRRCSNGPNKSHSKVDSRSVQSDSAFVSPTRPSLIGSSKIKEEQVQKRSPSSIFDFVAERVPEVDSSEKKPGVSISSHERSVLKQFPGFDHSQRILHMSGVFSEIDTIDSSSFSDDAPASIFPSPHLSTGITSDPSDLTSYTRTLDTPPSSRAPKSSITTCQSEHYVPVADTGIASSFIAFPARLPNSTHGSLESRSNQGVPILVKCPPWTSLPRSLYARHRKES